uniref:Uncharacterized protein n=1 Tax=Ralstonia solanacearum TaxID=305 RepID=A0A0S4WDJ2_RALSL|nr:protein of unknown function [Ralstonia solanacearum]
MALRRNVAAGARCANHMAVRRASHALAARVDKHRCRGTMVNTRIAPAGVLALHALHPGLAGVRACFVLHGAALDCTPPRIDKRAIREKRPMAGSSTRAVSPIGNRPPAFNRIAHRQARPGAMTSATI